MILRKKDIARNLTPEQVAQICVELCGGGFTAEQTQNAIIMHQDLLEGQIVLDPRDGIEWQIVKYKVVDTNGLINSLGRGYCSPDSNKGWYVIGPVMVNEDTFRMAHIATCGSKKQAVERATEYNSK